MKKAPRTKRRTINKAIDQRFALRNQRGSLGVENRRGKSLVDLPDTVRKGRKGHGPRRVQLGETLRQGELATRDPVRDKD